MKRVLDSKITGAVRFVSVLLLLLAGIGAESQTPTATLSGVVRDSTGAVVPQVKITLKNSAKGTARVSTTGGDGSYTFSNIEPGTYGLPAEHDGFSTEGKNGGVVGGRGSAVGGSAP